LDKREANFEDHLEDCKNMKADAQQKLETIKEKLTNPKK
jgi:F0F1-type ATP synthase membrane subunit b/b'